MILFVDERVFKFGFVFPLMVAKAVGYISAAKPTLRQIGRCHSSGSQTHSLGSVVGDARVYRTVVKLAVLARRCIP